MFVYVIYDVKTLDVCKVYLSEDDCAFDFMHDFLLPYGKYDRKGINIDCAFKLIMDMLY